MQDISNIMDWLKNVSQHHDSPLSVSPKPAQDVEGEDLQDTILGNGPDASTPQQVTLTQTDHQQQQQTLQRQDAPQTIPNRVQDSFSRFQSAILAFVEPLSPSSFNNNPTRPSNALLAATIRSTVLEILELAVLHMAASASTSGGSSSSEIPAASAARSLIPLIDTARIQFRTFLSACDDFAQGVSSWLAVTHAALSLTRAVTDLVDKLTATPDNNNNNNNGEEEETLVHRGMARKQNPRASTGGNVTCMQINQVAIRIQVAEDVEARSTAMHEEKKRLQKEDAYSEGDVYTQDNWDHYRVWRQELVRSKLEGRGQAGKQNGA